MIIFLRKIQRCSVSTLNNTGVMLNSVDTSDNTGYSSNIRQKTQKNGMAPKIPKVYQVWQLYYYSTQQEKLNLGAFLKMATNWTSFVHSALYIKKSIFQFKYQKEYEICTLSGPSDMVWVEQEKIQLWKLDTENSTQRMQ